MDKIRKSTRLWIMISVVMMLVSAIGASLVQTNFGKVTVKKITWVTDNGYAMSGTLFIPETATVDNPAPAIVTSHGMYNNSGMQDANFVELSRRGYVVLAQDMPSHGDSDDVDNIVSIMMGLYESVKELASMPYVDSENIGITGHSLGGMSSNTAVTLDNLAETPLVSAVLLNCADATYTDDDGAYTNIYGSRDVGIIAVQYDEFFFLDEDENGNETLAKDFIYNNNAQSFLYFGTDPDGQEQRSSYTVYTQEVDGEEAMRVIYNPAITHPWSHFSARSTTAVIDFFEEALGAPNPISSSSQIWQFKEAFNLLGLIGFFLFIANLAVQLTFTQAFSSLRTTDVVKARPINSKGKIWFFCSLAICALLCTILFIPITNGLNSHSSVKEYWPQSSPWGVGVWAATCGVISLISMLIWYYAVGKKDGVNMAERGAIIPLKKLGLTALLGIIVAAAGYGCVFLADYFFQVDFRIWVLAVRPFTSDKLILSLFPYLPLFLIFYVLSSIASNCVNYNTVGGKSWVNTAIVAFATVFPAIILPLIQYIPYVTGGSMTWPDANMVCIWLFPMVVILPVSVIISRKIYKVTNNPYLGGIINAIIVTLISCTNTLTWG